MSAVFAAVNRNKRGIALDLQKPDGARILRELAARSDVLVENFVPGVADRLGVGYAAVSGVNPGIVYVSVSGFGQTGPYAQRPGYNTIAQGMGGLMGVTGMPGHPPTRPAGRSPTWRRPTSPSAPPTPRSCTGCAPDAGSTST